MSAPHQEFPCRHRISVEGSAGILHKDSRVELIDGELAAFPQAQLDLSSSFAD
jgi:hypothetical protein